MKNTFLFLLPIILMTIAGQALAQPIITQISKSYSYNSVQLFFSFTSPPKYTINNKGKRIDLTLENTISADKLVLPETDGKIVKVLSLLKDKTTTISFFFRYPPQKIKVAPGQEANKLILDILLGNEFTTTHPLSADRLQGMSVLQRKTEDFSNPVKASPYPGNWQKFLKEYETELKIEPAVQFSMVPFPAITLLPPDMEENIALLPSEITEGAGLKSWNDLIPLIIEQLSNEKDPENKKKLTLTYGDILLRAGNFQEAYKQFYLLSIQYTTEPVGILAKYLLLRLQAEYANPYLANIELRNLESGMDKNNPAFPYLILTQIETALASKQFEQMGTLLERDDVALPARIAPMKALRQADYWLAQGDTVKAHAGYQLLDGTGIFTEHNASLNGYCSVLYRHERFKEAADCYDRLAKQSSTGTQQQLDMISFRKAMAKLHGTPGASHESDMINDFAQIESTYPNTEAGTRAALKQIDLKLLTLKNWEKPALTYYQPLAEMAVSRSIREEASFKVALVYHMLGQNAKSTDLLMTFLRDFKSGPLHDTALALLIEILPDLLKEDIKNGKYIEALVLAKQNRYLFINNWIDISLLLDMAEAYRQLGFFNEASKMYIYLLDVSTQEDKEPYYLPLIKLAYEQGDYEVVEEYADQYAYYYPKGQDLEEVLYLRLQNLMTHNKYKEALSFLSGKNFKEPRFKSLEATLAFYLNDYARAKILLEEMQVTPATEQVDHLFMLAESTYQLGDIQKAEELFIPLQQDSLHQDQVVFRLAEIARKNGQRERALKLFTQIVETGSNPLWKELAKKELVLTALSK
ncbi:MAG: tetratricopeptide repeat protein [Proteobacteria bacterium]|nr:tetratricopeptide repeat protein [Pseudomonadota bacterium]MBU1649761.1 tetratricopeptide repeat protein [Pseudomonadota bacterium]